MILYLVMVAIVMSSNIIHGNQVVCSHPGGVGNVPQEVYNSYCSSYGIFTIIEQFNKSMGTEIVFPGLGSKWLSIVFVLLQLDYKINLFLN